MQKEFLHSCTSPVVDYLKFRLGEDPKAVPSDPQSPELLGYIVGYAQ
jgi:hypothetical protein